MSLARRATFTAALLVAAAGCNDPSSPAVAKITSLPRDLTNTERAITQGSNAFAFSLLSAVNRTFADSNVFISPLSASMALGVTTDHSTAPEAVSSASTTPSVRTT